MSAAALIGVQTRYALLTMLRTPRAMVFGALFPIVFVVLFNSIFTQGGPQTTTVAGHEVSIHAYFTAGLIAYAAALSCFSTTMMTLTAARERGQLKRQRGMPVPPWTFVAAQVARATAFAFGIAAVMLAIGIVFYGIDLPLRAVPGFVIYLALGTVALSALGIAATALVTSEESAQPIAGFAVVMLSFVSGVFIQADTLPSILQEIGRIFPLYHLAAGLQTALAEGSSGIGLSFGGVTALVIWALVGLRIAERSFRWEPQTAAV